MDMIAVAVMIAGAITGTIIGLIPDKKNDKRCDEERAGKDNGGKTAWLSHF